MLLYFIIVINRNNSDNLTIIFITAIHSPVIPTETNVYMIYKWNYEKPSYK